MISTDGETITQGAVLSFHNICYRGQEKRGSLLRRRTVEKEILSNISGIMKPGLNAIMGPPGGDKSFSTKQTGVLKAEGNTKLPL
ncbi:Hypothetical predicted protein [Marmota monax]|uniref:ABC transporter domain-containing protein n=1 Tax=Marmota monax TaxID=9995 RepID=A0A5E4BTH6_MARMO|nr:hypothetical protein GHT09_014587 [Marmota monax]VTJ72805.1 Hypothetical predicted protein [Marmota monax]